MMFVDLHPHLLKSAKDQQVFNVRHLLGAD